MKKQASTLLPALLDLLRQYLALDMAVYAWFFHTFHRQFK